MSLIHTTAKADLPRVLIVDDTPSNLVVLEMILRDQYQVTSARSGREALALLDETHFDLILLDIIMPDLDGFETLAAMQQHPGFSNTPVIFLTASTELVDQKRGLSLGAADYITKPFDRDIVLLRMHNILQRLQLQVRLELAISSSRLTFWSWNIQSGKIRFDRNLYHATLPMHPPINAHEMQWEAICHPEDLAAIEQRITRYQAGEVSTFDVDIRLCSHLGDWFWVNLYGTASNRDASGNFEELIGTYRNIQARKQAEIALQKSEERLRYVMEATGEGIWDWVIQSNVVTHNRAWCRILGLDDSYLTHPLEDYKGLIHPEDIERIDRDLVACLGCDAPYNVEYRLKHASGDYIWVNDRGRVVERTDEGIPVRIVGSIRDITERKHHEAEIRNLAFHDTLTGLPNRRLLMDRLQQALSNNQRKKTLGALMFIDLDRFKQLNDTRGHDVGDMLLVEIANRLRQCVRESDTVARLGGDEFVVMLAELTTDKAPAKEAALGVASKILEDLNRPYQLGEHEHHSSPSIGVTLFYGPPDAPEHIIKRADDAMYRAKAEGRNCIRFDAKAQLLG